MKGKKILITAGPTFEPIDPVRFIGNHSSGKMGYAIAEVCAMEGAEVILISGPVSIHLSHPNIQIIPVTTADEMYHECLEHFISCNAVILSAAVADFSPKITYRDKIKRGKEDFNIELKPTIDIASELGKRKQQGQIIVGFALETTNEVENAVGKMQRKNFDFIVLNSTRDKGAGFGVDTNKITLIDKNNNIDNFELKTKKLVAMDIVEKLKSIL